MLRLPEGMKVFVSSVYRNLENIRDRLVKAIEAAGDVPVAMEAFGARPQQALSVCLEEVHKADVLVLLVGPQYGSIDTNSGLSYTHLEFREAIGSAIPVLAFEVGHSKQIGDQENEDNHKLEAFREEVRASVTTKILKDANTLPEQALASLRRFAQDWSSQVGQFRPFQTAADFFSSMLDPKAVFSHAHSIVGREDTLAELEQFLSSSLDVALFPGPGGVGKSKMLLELAQRSINKSIQVVFLGPQFELKGEHLRDLPNGEVCVVADDSHRLESLDAFVQVLLGASQSRPIKLLLTCRPCGLDRVRFALRAVSDDKIRVFPELQPLDPQTTALTLAQESIGPESREYAKRLAEISDGNPLIITVGGKLIRDGQISPDLLAHKDKFRIAALDGLLADLPPQIADGVPTRRLLEVLSAIGPVRPGREAVEDLAAQWLQVPKSSVVSSIASLRDVHCLLLRRGHKVRIRPDVLADHLLYQASVAGNEPTGFIEEVFAHFGSEYLSNILTNASELEWRCRASGSPVNVLDQVWLTIRDNLPKMSHRIRADLLKHLRGAAWFAPAEIWQIVSWLAEHQAAPADSSTFAQALHIDQDAVIRQIPQLLKIISWHENFTERCVKLLWKLGEGDDRPIHSYPEAPLRVLQDILSYDPQKSLSIQHRALTSLHEAAREDRERSVHKDISNVISVVLSRDPTFSRSDGARIIFETIQLQANMPEVQSLRERAIVMLKDQASDIDPALSVRAIEGISTLFHAPHGSFGRQVTNEELHSWQAEVEKCAGILAEIACNASHPAVAYHARRKLQETSIFSNWPDLEDAVEKLVAKVPQREEFRIYDLLLPAYEAAHRRKDWRQGEKEHVEMVRRSAGNLWAECGAPEELVNRIGTAGNELSSAGLIQDNRLLIISLCEACPAKTPELALAIVRGTFASLQHTCGVVFSEWFDIDPGAAHGEIRRSIIDGDENVLSGIASGYVTNWFRHPELQCHDHLQNIRLLLACPHKGIRRIAANSLWWARGICEREAMDVLIETDFDGDVLMLDAALKAIDSTHGIDPDLLTEHDVTAILQQLQTIPRLTHNSYHVEQFLSVASEKHPAAVIDMLLERIRTAASLPDGSADRFQPLPYLDFHKSIDTLAGSAEYGNLLRRIRNEVLKDDRAFDFWVPKLYASASADFCPTAMDVLKEWTTSDDPERLVASVHLITAAEHAFVFIQHEFVSECLINAKKLAGDCLGNVRSSLFKVAISGTVSSSFGKAPPRYVQDQERAEQLADTYKEKAVVTEFYKDLSGQFKHMIQESLARHEELLDE